MSSNRNNTTNENSSVKKKAWKVLFNHFKLNRNLSYENIETDIKQIKN